MPQWAALALTSTHATPHIRLGAGQVVMQVPPAQTWPAAQALPQAPQLATSLSRSRQASPQSRSDPVHTRTHAPAEHA